MNIIIKIIKWAISIFMAFLSLVFFTTKGGFFSAILFLLIAVIVNPIVEDLLKKRGLKLRKIIFIPLAVALFIIACVIVPPFEKNVEKSNDNNQETVFVVENIEDNETLSNNVNRSLLNEGAETNNSDNIVFNEQQDDKLREEQLIKEKEEQAEQERLAKEQEEKEKAEQERLAKEQEEKEKAEQERLAKEQEEKEKAELEQIVQETADTQRNRNSGNANNFDLYDTPEQQNTTDEWVLNTSTLKIHYPLCKDVRKIKPENYSTSNLSVTELQSQGYTTCGHCFR